MRHKRPPSTVARVNGRQRLAQVNRRQASVELVSRSKIRSETMRGGLSLGGTNGPG